MSMMNRRKVVFKFVEQDGRCAICGKEMMWQKGNFDQDHIVPKRLGGGNEWSNIQLTHTRCNRRRAKRFSELVLDGRPEYIEYIKRKKK